MFHLSLPVRQFDACLAFYSDCFEAAVEPLGPGIANLFVFGGQVTLHDRAASGLTDDLRREMHFGQVVAPDEWTRLRNRIAASGYSPLRETLPDEAPNGRGKLLVVDPSGNLVEINSTALGG